MDRERKVYEMGERGMERIVELIDGPHRVVARDFKNGVVRVGGLGYSCHAREVGEVSTVGGMRLCHSVASVWAAQSTMFNYRH